ncbi:hypothetical protein F4777DRAFT_563250 [Nemania sp. FL0916]|nr:hypothetical protein F4777DRAFT_563250 [Nemania sp. FL0916]
MSAGKAEQAAHDAEDPVLLFRELEEDEIPDDEIPMFRIFTATLQYPIDNKIKSAKLASDINFVCQAEAVTERIGDVIMYIWMQLIQIAHCAPPDHPWIDCLVETIEILQNQEGTVPGMGEFGFWSKLLYFDDQMYEKFDYYVPIINPSGTPPKRELTGWKALNTFAIKLMKGPMRWFSFVLHSMRHALEEPIGTGDIQSCRLWVASKWIIVHGNAFHDCMVSLRTDEDAFESFRLKPGKLCGDGVSPLGDDRWEYWQKQLQAQKSDSKNLEIDDETVQLMSEAIEKMNTILGEKS